MADHESTPPESIDRHFFRPLLPDFRVRFLIPLAFRKYLNATIPGTVILRSSYGGHEVWHVEVDGEWHFKEGWEKFCKDHHLRVGDFLVFKHRGNLLFDVVVLDPCACERSPLIVARGATNDTRSSRSSETVSKSDQKTSSEFLTWNTITRASGSGIFIVDNKGAKAVAVDPLPKAKASSTSSEYSCFQITLGRSVLKYNMLLIPRNFAKMNGLWEKRCEMILIDHKERHWKVRLSYKSAASTYIRRGLHAFLTANQLKVGDVMLFEFLRLGNTPALKGIKLAS